jgi:hypothetical protein
MIYRRDSLNDFGRDVVSGSHGLDECPTDLPRPPARWDTTARRGSTIIRTR